MKVLLIHGLSRKSRRIISVFEHEMLLPINDSSSTYYIQDAQSAIPKSFKDFDFDGIVVTSTFMDLISDPVLSNQIQDKFDFLTQSTAYKIALPQDDYWMSEVRDSWYTRMKFNVVFPVCAPQYWKTLLPTFSDFGEIKQGYTTFLGKRFKEMHKNVDQKSKKKFDIVYRSTRYPLYPNQLGYLKGSLGMRFEDLSKNFNTRLSINVTGDFIKGHDWEDFIKSSKAILGSPSGSSTLVRNFEDLKQIRSISHTNSDFMYEALEALLPQGCSGVDYTAISPRNIEAAALGCLQILVPGSYGDILQPGWDYLPLDFSREGLLLIEETLKNEKKTNDFISNCWNTLIGYRDLQEEYFIKDVQDRILNHSIKQRKTIDSSRSVSPKVTKIESGTQKLLAIVGSIRSILIEIKRSMLHKRGS